MQEADKSAAIKVYVRVRPLVGHEATSQEVVTVEEDGRTVNIEIDAITKIQTKFDQAIPKEATQIEVFSHFRDYIGRIPEGYNMTVFAYGQTGSGKTYTMFGSDWEYTNAKEAKSQRQNTFFENLDSDENYAGLIPRTIHGLFGEINRFTSDSSQNFNIYCSFLQIYNEKIYDLLQDFPKPKALNLHESKIDGIFVEGLAEYAVTHYSDCLELMKRGEKNRFIRQTSMNTKSSRSHTIFQILLESTTPDVKGFFRKARLNLCDLAGSEKINKTEEMSDDHFRELKNINQSLTTLGKVIASLSSKNKSVASFRESKLTRLLQDSLTANTYTFIIGNISPSSNSADETMNTLKFVERARHIVMKVKPMEFNGQNMEVVNKLQKELLNLKRKGLSPEDIHSRLVTLQEENEKLKKTAVSMQDVERLIEENRKMKMEIHKLQTSTQYAHSEGEEARSDFNSSVFERSHAESNDELSPKKKSGFELPERRVRSPHSETNIEIYSYEPASTKKSLISAGRTAMQSEHSSAYTAVSSRISGKEKQKILDRLEELERIKKFNEEKLIKDLEQLERKNASQPKSNSGTPLKKKLSDLSSVENKRSFNYEDKIRQLEAKLFGR